MAPKPLDVTTRMFETAFASPTSRFELCVDTLEFQFVVTMLEPGDELRVNDRFQLQHLSPL